MSLTRRGKIGKKTLLFGKIRLGRCSKVQKDIIHVHKIHHFPSTIHEMYAVVTSEAKWTFFNTGTLRDLIVISGCKCIEKVFARR